MTEPKRVLIVDDSSITAKQLKKIIEEIPGFSVVGEGRNGAEGLAKYQELKPDIVCMDIVMPLMDGLEATRLILQFDTGAAIVMVSSVGGDREKALEALRLGAKTIIAKPFQAERVRDTLSALVG